MEKKQLDAALALGLETQEELKAFDLGYTMGEGDTLSMVNDDLSWLNEDFTPKNVTVHENHGKEIS